MYPVFTVSIEEVNETVCNVGKWIFATGVLGFVFHGLFFVFVITQSFNPSFPGFPISILFTPIVVIYIVALIKIRKLESISGDDLFSTGPIVIIVGLIFNLIMGFLLIGALTGFGIEPPTTFNPFVFLFTIFFTSVASLIVLAGNIMLAIAFWHFGELNKSNLIRLGAVLQILLNVIFLSFIGDIGLILIGLQLYFLASKSREALSSPTTLMIIRNELSRGKPSGTVVDLRTIAEKYGLSPYLLIPLVKHWIAIGELKGMLDGYKYVSYSIEI